MTIPFIVIGAVGLVLLLMSFLLDEALGEFINVFDSDVLSGTAIGGFLTTFGFAGYLAQSAFGPLIGIVLGVLGGAAVAAGVVWMTRALLRSSDEDTVRTADLVGAHGTVVTDIPEDGLGQISVVVAGHLLRVSARTAGRSSIPDRRLAVYGPGVDETLSAGTEVVVTSILSPTAVEVTRA